MNVDLRDAQKEDVQYVATPLDVYPVLLPKVFFIILFCFSTIPFNCKWYADVIRCTTTVRSCKQVHTLLTNFLPDHLFGFKSNHDNTKSHREK